MPLDENGNYKRPNGPTSWQDDRDQQINILASRHDSDGEDMAGAISAMIPADGRKAMSGPLKMGGNPITGAGPAVLESGVPTVKQIRGNAFNYASDNSLTANTINISLTPAPTSQPDSMLLIVRVANTNTAATTIVVNGLAAKPVRLGAADIYEGTLLAGETYLMFYNKSDDAYQLILSGSNTGGGQFPLLSFHDFDSALSGTQLFGWELQGTKCYNSKYFDAYKILLDEINDAATVANFETVKGQIFTYKRAASGRRFYNITDYNARLALCGHSGGYVLDTDGAYFILPVDRNFSRATDDPGALGTYHDDQMQNITGELSAGAGAGSLARIGGVFKRSAVQFIMGMFYNTASQNSAIFDASTQVRTGVAGSAHDTGSGLDETMPKHTFKIRYYRVGGAYSESMSASAIAAQAAAQQAAASESAAETSAQAAQTSAAAAAVSATAAQDASNQFAGQIDDKIAVESQARAAADTQLQNNINAEASTRAAADTQLQNNLNAETQARIAGDDNLQKQVNAIQGQGGFIDAFNFGDPAITTGTAQPWWSLVPDPTAVNAWQNALTAYAMQDIKPTPSTPADIFDKTSVVNLFNGHGWRLTNTPNTIPPVFKWGDIGPISIAPATPTVLGGVKVPASGGQTVDGVGNLALSVPADGKTYAYKNAGTAGAPNIGPVEVLFSGGKNLFETYYSFSGRAEDNVGAMPGWTGFYLSNASSIYPDSYAKLKTRPELLTDIVTYNNLVGTKGQCDLFVVDEVPGSVRFPKITRGVYAVRNSDGSDKGVYNDQIQNFTAAGIGAKADWTPSGIAQRLGGAGGGNASTTANQFYNTILDASLQIRTGTETYSAHMRIFPWIYFYNAAVPSSTAQNAAFLQEIMNMQNAVGFTSAGKDTLSGLSKPDQTRIVPQTLGASGSLITAQANGTLKLSAGLTAGNYVAFFRGNNTSVAYLEDIANASSAQNYIIRADVAKGDIIRIQYSAAPTVNSFTFIYALGAQ